MQLVSVAAASNCPDVAQPGCIWWEKWKNLHKKVQTGVLFVFLMDILSKTLSVNMRNLPKIPNIAAPAAELGVLSVVIQRAI